MDDLLFFKEEAERCRSQAVDSADPTVKATLETLADGFAAYADCLKDRQIIANELEPPIPETTFLDQDHDWFWVEDEKTESKPASPWPTIRSVAFVMFLMMPGMASLVWMLWKRIG
jgi:hypothetical protein